ncbi:MAG: LamB/YcsF family protein, partial [Chloroflexi bacterium]|nr:LamB/YcsF family protein [Chloroflexota bacterium]
HTDPSVAAAQAVSIARDGRVRAHDGSMLEIRADTICIHGDTPGAAAIAKAVREALDAAGIEVRPLTRA